MPLSPTFSLSLALAVMLAAPDPSAETPELVAAKRLYSQERFDEAARLFEEHFDRTADFRLLYNAAISRYAAGHPHLAKAIFLSQRYLDTAPDLAKDRIASLSQRIDTAKALSTPVELAIDIPPGALPPASIAFFPTNLSHSPQDAFTLPWPQDAISLHVHLDPGSWSASLSLQSPSSTACPRCMDT